MSQLPQTVPHFVSRDQECEAIKKYLCPTNNCRCVLVHGVTGVGKTSTAIKVANERLNSDSRTVVAYANCRYIRSLDDFSEKVLQQVYHYPVENPISELKNRLKSQDFYTILLLDNFEFLLHLDDGGQETSNELQVVQERMNPQNEKSKVGDYDSAKQYSEDALKMRLDLLKDHRDTAKSLFDLGMVHKEREEFQEAKDCLEKSETIQMKVLDDNIRDLQR